jgi:hypothetical protein
MGTGARNENASRQKDWNPALIASKAQRLYQSRVAKRSEFSAFCYGGRALTFDKIASQRTPHA